MSLNAFLNALMFDGRVRTLAVAGLGKVPFVFQRTDLDEAADFLAGFEREYRLELPGPPPELSREAMLWAAQTVYRACSLLSHRDADADAVRRAMSEPCPVDSSSPSTHYSADLTLRFLPDLVRLTRAASSNDPLTDELMRLAKQWPLSSVGITDVGPVDPSVLVGDPTLLRLYVDRIISADDGPRLDNSIVKEAVRVAIGRYADLANKRVDSLVASN